jgi:hypothetical protein
VSDQEKLRVNREYAMSASDAAKQFDFKDDERAKKSFKRIHRGLLRAGFKSLGAGIYVHPDGTKYTVNYKGK